MNVQLLRSSTYDVMYYVMYYDRRIKNRTFTVVIITGSKPMNIIYRSKSRE